MDTMSVQNDHVHVFLSFPPKVSISEAAKILKGVSSRKIREEFPELEQKMWGAPVWAVGYYAATVGDRTVSQQIRKYIQKQEYAKDQPKML